MFLLTGPTQKSSKYGTEKITKYTGPTQDTKDDRVFNNWNLNLVIFYVGGDQFQLRTFLGGTSQKKHPV